eukprot:3048145-Pleurochrysis_carterae.AAC.1
MCSLMRVGAHTAHRLRGCADAHTQQARRARAHARTRARAHARTRVWEVCSRTHRAVLRSWRPSDAVKPNECMRGCSLAKSAPAR